MEFANHIRRRIRRIRYRAVAALATAWVALGVQPCAIAALSDLDCPHCPTSHQETEGGEHHGHHVESGESESSHHHEDPRESPQADCCESGEGATDARLTLAKYKDNPEKGCLVATAPRAAIVGLALLDTSSDPPDRPPAPSGRIHLLNCVFLD